jgi:polyhydroxybutyrate depolymerase
MKHLLLHLCLSLVCFFSVGPLANAADPLKVPGYEDQGRQPAKVFLPSGYRTREQWPVVILLHGYQSSRAAQNLYFGFTARRNSKGFIAVLPEGTRNSQGKRFWNATDWCCDFDQSGVDDLGYLKALLVEVQKKYKADPKRITVLGHSNGGFMAYRLACDAAGLVAGVASLAGGSFFDSTRCQPESPVSVLQIHSVDDPVVPYLPKQPTSQGPGVPGAENTVRQWVAHNGCDPQPFQGPSRNSIWGLGKEDTSVSSYQRCHAGTEVALWRIREGGVSPHIPPLRLDFIGSVLDFLLAQRKSD